MALALKFRLTLSTPPFQRFFFFVFNILKHFQQHCPHSPTHLTENRKKIETKVRARICIRTFLERLSTNCIYTNAKHFGTFCITMDFVLLLANLGTNTLNSVEPNRSQNIVSGNMHKLCKFMCFTCKNPLAARALNLMVKKKSPHSCLVYLRNSFRLTRVYSFTHKNKCTHTQAAATAPE